MQGILIEQAIVLGGPDLSVRARSPGFQESWLPEVRFILTGYGERLTGVACPEALFVQPLGKNHVAIVQVADQVVGNDERVLGFRFLVLDRKAYEQHLGDPFLISDRLRPDWTRQGELGTITWTDLNPPPRTVAQVQAVLKRVKANALKEGEDPEAADFERTEENSESPALLGGAQILVDGGRLVFESKTPNPDMIRGLWTLLPNRTRARLYPATFAYSGELQFDVVVLPRLNLLANPEGYSTEEMACHYPGSSYELALQQAAESGDQASLNSLLNRRDSLETLRLAGMLLVGMILVIVFFNVFFPSRPVAPSFDEKEHRAKTAAAAGIVSVQDPFTIVGLKLHGDYLFLRPDPAPKAARSE